LQVQFPGHHKELIYAGISEPSDPWEFTLKMQKSSINYPSWTPGKGGGWLERIIRTELFSQEDPAPLGCMVTITCGASDHEDNPHSGDG